jgi:hypothetical protein
MITVTLRPLSDDHSHRTDFAMKTVEKLQAIVNDPRFDEKLQSATYKSRRFLNDAGVFVDANNDLVRQIIIGGKESKTAPDGTIDLQITFAKLRPKILGYVLPPNPVITTNTIFVDDLQSRNDYLSLAAHWMHEWMHVAGFYHPRWKAKGDVAYSIGNFVTDVGLALAGQEDFNKGVAQQLGQLYLEATQGDDVDCPVFEDGVPAEIIRTEE